MSAKCQSPTSESHAWASALVRPLSRRYLFVLTSVAVLVLVDQAILQPLLVRLNFFAPVINLAGRQRMLSQKVTKDVLALAATDDIEARAARRDELLRSLEQWTAAHRTLMGDDRTNNVRPVESSIKAVLQRVEPAFEAIRAAAGDIAAAGPQSTSAKTHPSVAVILEQEPNYLRGMESVVALFEESAKAQVSRLRWCGLIVMMTVIMLLVGVYFFVLQPAARLIRGQVEQLAVSDTRHRLLAEMLSEARDELELRVARRTSELSAANLALEHEMAERQAAELRMRELSTELAQASRVTALGQLATGLAHEINQPLATVANYAGTLELTLEREYPDDQESRRLVVQLKQAALRAGAIVRHMRNFVRNGAGHSAPADLNDLIRDVSELCRPQMQEANVRWAVELAPGPILIYADALQIQQVLVNLIQNAIQSMASSPASERMLQISVAVGPFEVGVTVADTGPGFPSESIAKSFEPFVSTKPDGLGMGLAISRSIIQQHQGRIWSENRESGGAVVGFSLPLFHAHDISKEQHAHCVCG